MPLGTGVLKRECCGVAVMMLGGRFLPPLSDIGLDGEAGDARGASAEPSDASGGGRGRSIGDSKLTPAPARRAASSASGIIFARPADEALLT